MDIKASNPRYSQEFFTLGDTTKAVFSLNFPILPAEIAFFDPKSDEISIKNAKILENGELEIEFIAWKSGKIAIPAATSGDFRIFFEPIAVPSICASLQIDEFRPPIPPISPFSALRSLYFCAVLTMFFLATTAFFAAKFKKIRIFFTNLAKKMFKSQEYRVFIKNFRKIDQKMRIDDEFLSKINRLLREYLQKSFEKPFISTVSSKIPLFFAEISQKNLILSKNDIDFVCNFFTSSDLARFSKKSASKCDFSQICEKIPKIVLAFEMQKIRANEKTGGFL